MIQYVARLGLIVCGVWLDAYLLAVMPNYLAEPPMSMPLGIARMVMLLFAPVGIGVIVYAVIGEGRN